jgi:MinD-like ATPase involved in chromosome partitioning or flagellar assembly
MKNVITATGVEELNKMMSKHPQIHVVDIDIQKQETIWEKFIDPAYKGADVLVIMDRLSGPFTKYELLSEVRKQFQGEIYVILTDTHDEQYIKFLRELKITNIFSDDDDPMELIDAIAYDIDAAPAAPIDVQEVEKIEKVYIQKQVIAVVGTGGAGKTTLALDLAELLARDKYDVVVVDLNLEKADIGRITGAEELGIQEVMRVDFSESAVMDAVTQKKGIYYFTGLREMVEISEAIKSVRGIIKVLRKHYDVVLLDTGNISSMATHTAIMESDQQLFIFNPAERSIKAIKNYLDLYNRVLEKTLKATGIINQFVDSGLNSRDVSEVLGIKIHGQIRMDKAIFTDIEKGRGFVRDAKVIKQAKDALFPKKERSSGFRLFKRG